MLAGALRERVSLEQIEHERERERERKRGGALTIIRWCVRVANDAD